jgi:hypothetical protein
MGWPARLSPREVAHQCRRLVAIVATPAASIAGGQLRRKARAGRLILAARSRLQVAMFGMVATPPLPLPAGNFAAKPMAARLSPREFAHSRDVCTVPEPAAIRAVRSRAGNYRNSGHVAAWQAVTPVAARLAPREVADKSQPDGIKISCHYQALSSPVATSCNAEAKLPDSRREKPPTGRDGCDVPGPAAIWAVRYPYQLSNRPSRVCSTNSSRSERSMAIESWQPFLTIA